LQQRETEALSSTPLLDRTNEAAPIEWVEVVSPKRVENSAPTGDLIIALGQLRSSIQRGSIDSITIDTDRFDALDEDDIVAGQHATEAWDE
jgi:hypothetical protein